MPTVTLDVEEIPHGHGMSTKLGIADGLLEERKPKGEVPNGHDASYKRGVQIGTALRQEIANLVKK